MLLDIHTHTQTKTYSPHTLHPVAQTTLANGAEQGISHAHLAGNHLTIYKSMFKRHLGIASNPRTVPGALDTASALKVLL